jgi:hypothetical protein
MLGATGAAAAPDPGNSGSCSLDAWSPATSGITTDMTGYGSVNIGNVFTSNVTGTVCALGIYAGNNATYSNSETVGLYDSLGNLLTSTTVTNSTTAYDGYYWASTAPAQVIAGETYTVVDFTNGNGWGFGPAPINNWGTFTGQVMDFNSSLDLPLYGSDFPLAAYGGNVEIGDTPEPGTLLLFGSGLLGLAGTLRRKLRRG